MKYINMVSAKTCTVLVGLVVGVLGQCQTFYDGLCPGPEACKCTTGVFALLVNLGSYQKGGGCGIQDPSLAALGTIEGSCPGSCRQTIAGECPGGNTCLKDAGSCSGGGGRCLDPCGSPCACCGMAAPTNDIRHRACNRRTSKPSFLPYFLRRIFLQLRALSPVWRLFFR